MILETQIDLALDADIETLEGGNPNEIVTFPARAVIDTKEKVYFWEEPSDGTTIFVMGDHTINSLEKFEDFKKKYLSGV